MALSQVYRRLSWSICHSSRQWTRTIFWGSLLLVLIPVWSWHPHLSSNCHHRYKYRSLYPIPVHGHPRYNILIFSTCRAHNCHLLSLNHMNSTKRYSYQALTQAQALLAHGHTSWSNPLKTQPIKANKTSLSTHTMISVSIRNSWQPTHKHS